MPFINQVVVATPAAMAHEVDAPKGLPLVVVTDEQLLGDRCAGLRGHQERNFMLRAKLIRSDLVGNEFIMSDDDSRPRRPIPREVFIEKGKCHSYYFYNLKSWPGRRTNFDRGQHNTRRLLGRYGYPQLAYAAHMPQLIYRDCYRACLERFAPEWDGAALCEWSLYFNYAASEFKERFHAPQPYLTFCWPDAPYTWPLYVEPQDLLFENFYPQFYGAGRVFAGLAETPGPDNAGEVNSAKEARWRQVGEARLLGRPLMADPWVRGSWLRRLAASVFAPYIRRKFSR